MQRLSTAQSIKKKMDSNELINAVVYARTSTKNDEQKDSCENQVMMANIFMKQHPNIVLTEEPYVDQGISGKSNLHREQFMTMLERIEKGDIDLIIVKTKARLCRSKAISNTLEEMMRDYKFSILTLSDGQIYDSSDRSSRLINGIKDVIDEDYVWGQSEYGKMTHQLRCQKKQLCAANETFGFKWNSEKKDLEICKEETEIKKQVFEWYVYNGYGVREIARMLADRGIYGIGNNNQIGPATITSWLKDTTAIGVFYINKNRSELEIGENRSTKVHVNNKEDWIRIDRPELAFLDKELFNMAQRIMEEKKNVYNKPNSTPSQARFKGFHLFAGKVFCGSCGNQYTHLFTDRKKSIGAYSDYFSKKPNKKADETCNNKDYKKVYEITLSNITKKAISLTLENKNDIFKNLFSVISEAIHETQNGVKDTSKLKKQLKKLETEKTSYFESWRTAPDQDMKDYFYQKITEIKEKIATVSRELDSSENQSVDDSSIKKQLLNVKERLDAFKNIETLDRNIVDNFVDRITINEDGTLYIALKAGTKFKTDLPDYKEVAAKLRNGEAVQPYIYENGMITFIRNVRDFFFILDNVGKLFRIARNTGCRTISRCIIRKR